MNKQYARLKALLAETGIVFTEGGISDAEIYAYSSAMHTLEEQLEETLEQLFYRSGDAVPYHYCSLTGIPADLASRETLLEETLLPEGGRYAADDFYAAFAASGGSTLTLDGTTVTVSAADEAQLPLLGRFLRQYLPFTLTVRYDGERMCFDDWDAWGMTFDEYDRLALPFSVIDTLRKDE